MPQNDLGAETRLREAADALWDARSILRPIPPLRQWLDATNLSGAYAVQRLNTARRLSVGGRQIGRKIGLTSAAIQRQLIGLTTIEPAAPVETARGGGHLP